MRGHINQDLARKGDVTDPTWIVEPKTKGVANVVVWVDPPKGQYFPKPTKKSWSDSVVIDQPFCTYVPHVVVLYPEYFDGTAFQPTGQKLTIRNSSTINHGVRTSGRDNPSRGGITQPGQQLHFSLKLDREAIDIRNDVKRWMSAFAITLDHPYAAVSDAAGRFEIANIPAGVELSVVAWHEAKKRFVPAIEGGNKVRLDKGATKEIAFKIAK